MPTLDPPRTRAFGARVRRQVHAGTVAVQFLTRLPLPAIDLSDEADRRATLGQATAYFPAVGGLIGATTAATILLAGQVWPIGLAVVVGLVIEAILTGAFHEDAVADCCDAFGGGWTRDDVLRILKDSRVGAFGALGMGLAVALRGGALATIPGDQFAAATVASATLGRWAILPAMALLPPLADRASLSRDVGQPLGPGRLALGTGLAALGCLPLALVAPGRLGGMVLAVAVLTILVVRYVRRRLGGMTGDCLGFVCYSAQVACLLVAAAHRLRGNQRMITADLVLVRHAPVDARYRGICYGRSDVALGEDGHSVSRQLAESLATWPIRHLIHQRSRADRHPRRSDCEQNWSQANRRLGAAGAGLRRLGTPDLGRHLCRDRRRHARPDPPAGHLPTAGGRDHPRVARSGRSPGTTGDRAMVSWWPSPTGDRSRRSGERCKTSIPSIGTIWSQPPAPGSL